MNLQVDSLYPDAMGPNTMSVEDFLNNGLPSLDNGIEERVKVASSNGNVLRYVCMIEGSRYLSCANCFRYSLSCYVSLYNDISKYTA